MSIFKTKFFSSPVFLSGLALACAVNISQAQDKAPMDDSETQLAKFGGAMHLTASKCGGYSEDQLNELKSQQKQTLAQNGMDGDSFEQAYAAGMKEAEARWEGLSEAEQKKTCDEVRDQSNQMTE
ncbi:hypothetical protein HG264_09340 [Pseudomonas sp. gcc21]|uniref:hypothetical protein n=1 Tax=Pseudomonas sp. gcc21 TaxID=2726989 RepID=UPI00145264C6|nr:hypothetical protein [Pseudomonas sp. gcc21]QJD59100.1 hypothetical protein HG264_09340 [Pseudomonas sp. gcc21]